MSNTRKMKREAAKNLYRQFCKNFAEVAARQNALDDQNNRFRINKRRRARYEERGDQILGRRPSFREWWKAVRTTEQAKEATPEEVQEHIEDLSWGDE